MKKLIRWVVYIKENKNIVGNTNNFAIIKKLDTMAFPDLLNQEKIFLFIRYKKKKDWDIKKIKKI